MPLDAADRTALALRDSNAELERAKGDLDMYHAAYTPLNGLGSTLITVAAAGLEGAIRGGLGSKALLGGMVPLSGVIGVGMAVGAVMTDNATLKEGLNAGARGLAAPAMSDLVCGLVTEKVDPQLFAKMQELKAYAAAKAAAPNATATLAAGAVAGVPAK